MGKKFSHLTYAQRCKIQAMLELDISKSEIARRLGIVRSTLYDEISRGTVTQLDTNLKPYEKYFADTGQAVYEKHRKNCGRPCKLAAASEFIAYAEDQILNKKLSPDALVGRCRKDKSFSITVCTSTLYKYIDLGLLKVKNIDLLRRVGLSTKSERVRKNLRLYGDSIELRNYDVNDRSSFGHWEIDTIVGSKKTAPVLLTLDERVSRLRHIFKIPSRSAEGVKVGLDKLKVIYGDSFSSVFKSITSDNGSEFASLPQQLPDVNIYYTHPYSSWERGTNENQNSLVRRFFPKGTDFSKIASETVSRVENWINQLPRKLFEYSSANEQFLFFERAAVGGMPVRLSERPAEWGC